jgi:hypothetical protein
MDIKKIEQVILKYNPLNLTRDDLIIYDELYIKISHIENINVDKLQNIFMDRFGDNSVLFEMRKNNNVYKNILEDILSNNIWKKN